jgi:hypothetical protein
MQWEKIHSTTFIYRCCLDFNLQSQNQVLNTHKLLKPSNSPPSAVSVVIFVNAAGYRGDFY